MEAFSPPPPPRKRARAPQALARPSKDPQASSRKSLTRRAMLALLPLPLLPTSAHGVTEPSAPYDAYARTYDALDGSNMLTRFLGFDSLRDELLTHATGTVVELGIGTGVNLSRYPGAVTSLTGVDTSADMLRIAVSRKGSVGFPVQFVQSSAEATGLPGGQFDTVVDTFSLCVYDQPEAALREMRRLVRPGGSVLLLEHTAAEGIVGAYQDATAGVVKSLSKGCAPNQRVQKMVVEAGFRIVEEINTLGGSIVAMRLVY